MSDERTMVESQMVERVACALALKFHGGYHVSREERQKWPHWKLCVEAARAVIEEMRTPTQEMRIAAWKLLDDNAKIGNLRAGNIPGNGMPDAILSALIDAALNPGQTG